MRLVSPNGETSFILVLPVTLRKRLLGAFGLLVIGTLVGLVIAEIIVALFLPQHILRTGAESLFFVSYDPEIGWTNRPGAAGTFQPNKEIPPFDVRINGLGCRGADVAPETPGGGRRVVFLGDSNTFGYGVAEEESFPEIAGRSLPADYQVLNAGVFGYGTDQAMLLFERDLASLKPDLVILGFSPGDVSDNMGSINARYSKPYFTLEGADLHLNNVPVPRTLTYLPRPARESGLGRLLYVRSHLYRLVAHRLVWSDRYTEGSLLEMGEEEGLRTTVAIIGRLRLLVESAGARLVVMLLPHEQWVAAEKKEWNARVGYYPILSMLLSRSGIPVLDSTPEFVARYGSGPSLFLPGDPVHINREGNALAADILIRYFVRAGVIPLSLPRRAT